MEHVLVSERPVEQSRLDDFDALVTLYRPRVLRFIWASLRDRETAENLTQECFIRAFKARSGYRGDSSASTWLLQIASNLIRSHESSQRLRFWRRALRPADSSGLADFMPDDQQASPEARAVAKQQLEIIWRAAGSLPERQRTVFLLRFVEDLELLEIAAVTGLREGTVKAHLFRALQSVRSALEIQARKS
jgi:RNA polymerase sigma-70 factor (ECF subfamily)